MHTPKRFRLHVFSQSLALALTCAFAAAGPALAVDLKDMVFNPGQLKPLDSVLNVRPGTRAPSFTLPGVVVGPAGSGQNARTVRLADYLGKKNVVLSFVPAAFTPVCSGQWPGYNMARDLFEDHDAVLLGISEDNLPTLYAWVTEMGGLWFPVLSDFHPRGAAARAFGLLRSDGMAERAIVIIDKRGIVRFARAFDINTRPDLGLIATELDKIAPPKR